jgi:hypothetical protein
MSVSDELEKTKLDLLKIQLEREKIQLEKEKYMQNSIKKSSGSVSQILKLAIKHIIQYTRYFFYFIRRRFFIIFIPFLTFLGCVRIIELAQTEHTAYIQKSYEKYISSKCDEPHAQCILANEHAENVYREKLMAEKLSNPWKLYEYEYQRLYAHNDCFPKKSMCISDAINEHGAQLKKIETGSDLDIVIWYLSKKIY